MPHVLGKEPEYWLGLPFVEFRFSPDMYSMCPRIS